LKSPFGYFLGTPLDIVVATGRWKENQVIAIINRWYALQTGINLSPLPKRADGVTHLSETLTRSKTAGEAAFSKREANSGRQPIVGSILAGGTQAAFCHNNPRRVSTQT